MEKLKENWQVIIFTMLITLVGSMLLSWATMRGSKIENAASVEYVDKGDAKLEAKIDTKADKDDLNAVIEDVRYTREKTDDIYKILIEEKNN